MVLSLRARQELFLSVLSFTSKTLQKGPKTLTAAVNDAGFFAVHPLSLFKTMAAYEFITQGCVNTHILYVV